MNEQENSGFKLNVGGPSIILLLCVLGLSMFAILTIRAAYNGLKLARTSKVAVQEYYMADLAADRTVYNIRNEALSGLNNGLSPEEISKKLLDMPEVESVEDGLVVCNVMINDNSSIRLELEGNADFTDLKVVSHKLTVDDMDGYSGTGFEIEEIELF